ncbi:hypothetical protein OB905_10220 [Halobacteria archaeon AArc-dxtr1]|nr:hypothetical protein [Halobacteria archaeon AArc-dxtr1]
MDAEIDRERGVLSPADRAYLLGEREMSHDQSARNAEARIRRRIRAAVLDFDLLLHTLPEKDRKQVFEATLTDDAVLDGLRATVAFVYLGLARYGVDFEDVLEPGVASAEEYLAATTRDATVSVDVDFDVSRTVESTLAGTTTRLREGEPITPRELFSVIMRGETAVAECDRIELLTVTDRDADPAFLERLATYLDGELTRESDSRAVIEMGASG